jgi:hypothetical protein
MTAWWRRNGTGRRRNGDETATKWRQNGDETATKWRRDGDKMATKRRRNGDGMAMGRGIGGVYAIPLGMERSVEKRPCHQTRHSVGMAPKYFWTHS